MRDSDTIFALATPPGRSALAVVRISGPAALEAVAALGAGVHLTPRRVSLRRVHDTVSGDKIDDALVTYFPKPRSFTGEDCVEFSLHGGRSVVTALTLALARMPFLRAAEAGEFTRRAFLNRKLDLTQAEAIADLIDSETEFQRKQALRVLDGALGKRIATWRGTLIGIAAELESLLDFSDEADVEEAIRLDVIEECRRLQREIQIEIIASRRATALRDGFTIVIAGPPNAGKSTLFNALVGRDAAIVTDLPGTTRDLIVAKLDLGGAPVTLVDSAGMRETRDPIETIGIRKAMGAARQADLVLWLVSPDSIGSELPDVGTPIFVVSSKSDLGGDRSRGFSISVKDSKSLERLEQELRQRAMVAVGDGSEGGLIRERHKLAIERCDRVLEALCCNLVAGQLELAAEDCRSAITSVESVIGVVTTEEVLGAIFQRFCIGK